MPNRIGATPLIAAVKNGHADSAELLYEQGAHPDLFLADRRGRSAVAHACINNDCKIDCWTISSVFGVIFYYHMLLCLGLFCSGASAVA